MTGAVARGAWTAPRVFRAAAAGAATVALALTGAVATAGAQVPPATTAAAQKPIGTAPTDKKAFTARVLLPTVGRAAPSSRARVVQRVSPYAPYDNDPQVLLVLETASGPGGPWYRVLLPVRPNGTSAWVSGAALQVRATPYRVRVRLGVRRLELLKAGKVLNRWSVGVGTPQNPTPQGLFALSEIVPQSNPRGFYGPFILTLSAHSDRLSDFDGGQGQVAIHGTNLPGLLGGAVSHGCVRMPNTGIKKVAKLVPPGAPVEILP
ncbi:MAG: L,D-transpeptidase family protein [Thermoleophilia bacterium]